MMQTKVISEAKWHALVGPWIGRVSELKTIDEPQAVAAELIKPKADPKPASEKATRGKDSKRSSKERKPPHVWTDEEKIYLLAHADMTARELEEVFGVSAKAVNHKRSKLRKH